MIHCRHAIIAVQALSNGQTFRIGALGRAGNCQKCHCTGQGMSNSTADEAVKFGKFDIHKSEIFIETSLSFAFVNLKPVVPGHLLVSPKRVVSRFADLDQKEVADLWILAQKVGTVTEAHFKADSLTLAIQDGPNAGQTVPHVHIHVLPRRPGDFEKNDDVYDAIDAGSQQFVSEELDLDKERRVRTHDEMAAEAAELRKLFE